MGFMDFLAGDKTQVADVARNPTLGNSTGINTNFGQVIANRNGVPGSAPQDQFRNQQMSFVNHLAQQAQGNGPSPAATMLSQGLASQTANANALAASQRGINPALAMRQAQMVNAQSAENAGAHAVLARQQEQINAQGMLGNALSQARGQDLQDQSLKDSFAQSLYSDANQRDLGLMNGQIQGGLGAANVDEQGNKRQGFGQFLGQMGQGVAGAAMLLA